MSLFRTSRLLIIASLALTAAGSVLASPAVAATHVEFVGTQLTITDTAGTSQKLVVNGNGFIFTVDDQSGSGSPTVGTDCLINGGGLADCLSPGPGATILATLGAGDDEIDASALSTPTTLQGEAGADKLTGGSGVDTLVGGPGADQFFGGAGDDVIDARDGENDTIIDCGAGTDIARVDMTGDTNIVNCETVSRGSASDGTPINTAVSMAMPSALPKAVGKKFSFTSESALKSTFLTAGLTPIIETKTVGMKGVPAKMKGSITSGDIVKMSPAPGSLVSWQLGQVLPTISVTTYLWEKDIAGKGCPYDAKRLQMVQTLTGMEYSKAEVLLKKHKCEYRVVKVTESAKADATRVSRAQLLRQKLSAKTAATPYWALDLQRPTAAGIGITFTDRPYSSWELAQKAAKAKFEKELGLGADGKLTATSSNFTALHMLVNEIGTGRMLGGARVDIRSSGTGKLITSATTSSTGMLTVSLPPLPKGTLQIDAVARGVNGFALNGWSSIPVASRGAKPFITTGGRLFGWSPKTGGFVPGDERKLPSALAPQVAGMNAQMLAMANALNSRVGGAWGPVAGALGSTSGSDMERFLAATKLGLQPGALVAGGDPSGCGPIFMPDRCKIMDDSDYVPGQPFLGVDFSAIAATMKAFTVPGTGDLGVATLQPPKVDSQIGFPGGGLLGPSIGSMLGTGLLGTVSAANSGLMGIGGGLGFLGLDSKGTVSIPPFGLPMLGANPDIDAKGNVRLRVN